MNACALQQCESDAGDVLYKSSKDALHLWTHIELPQNVSKSVKAACRHILAIDGLPVYINTHNIKVCIFGRESMHVDTWTKEETSDCVQDGRS